MLLKETFSLQDKLTPVFNMIFIQYIWITYPILAVIGFFLFYYRIKISLYYYKKKLFIYKKSIESSKNRIPRLENKVKRLENKLL